MDSIMDSYSRLLSEDLYFVGGSWNNFSIVAAHVWIVRYPTCLMPFGEVTLGRINRLTTSLRSTHQHRQRLREAYLPDPSHGSTQNWLIRSLDDRWFFGTGVKLSPSRLLAFYNVLEEQKRTHFHAYIIDSQYENFVNLCWHDSEKYVMMSRA